MSPTQAQVRQPTANIDPERRYPSMSEPIHGSAFDTTGKGIANPVASFWTTAAGGLTPDDGGTVTTKVVTHAVIEAIKVGNV